MRVTNNLLKLIAILLDYYDKKKTKGGIIRERFLKIYLIKFEAGKTVYPSCRLVYK